MYSELFVKLVFLVGIVVGGLLVTAILGAVDIKRMQECQRENNVYECEYVKGYWKVK